MHLPNKNNQWTWGMSLALNSKPYRETKGEQVNTTQGNMINRFKYHEDGCDIADTSREQSILNFFADRLN